jgi:hydroxyacylglutathione hydrolase
VTIIDPGTSESVVEYLKINQKTLQTILLTHHHTDHTGGVKDLQAHFPNVITFGPAIPGHHINHVIENEKEIKINGKTWEIFKTPGHTLDHLCYRYKNHLFCGDTLFSAGCGRIFEGTGKQLFNALETIKSLPDDTMLYPAHEYTLNNLAFAQYIDPHNHAILAHKNRVLAQRKDNLPSLPTSLKTEKNINPFLRCHIPEIQQNISKLSHTACTDALSTFIAMRTLKDHYQCR